MVDQSRTQVLAELGNRSVFPTAVELSRFSAFSAQNRVIDQAIGGEVAHVARRWRFWRMPMAGGVFLTDGSATEVSRRTQMTPRNTLLFSQI
jgi:hypothetical protein